MSRLEHINHPLYGQRILHVMSPVRWSGPKFLHETCSNYKVLDKTVKWLPMCHHYILVPENNNIPTTATTQSNRTNQIQQENNQEKSANNYQSYQNST